jgi:DNA-binding NtrC family response regulator
MPQKKIMVIDDDSDTRVSLFDLLQSEGYRVVTFENPYEALTRVQEVAPDAIILDVRMPQVNGIELLPSLKTAAPETPVVVLTAFANLDLFIEARQKGACEMVAKPFSTKALLQKLKTIVEQKSVSRGEP